ncbi:hypothetical protein MASR2M15_28730 [Anaerolineales bacterium]
MKVITLLNEKGGVGKTTLSATIGAGLAILGYRVLMIDADPQGHLTISYGCKKQHSLYDLFVRDAAFNDPGIVATISPNNYFPPNLEPGNGRLYIVPGNRETRLIAQALDREPFLIQQRIEELRRSNIVDVVIFDVSPTPSSFHAMIYLATDHIIYPTEVNLLSFDGLVQSLASTKGYSKKKEEQGLEGIRLTGIVPMKFRPKTLEHAENLQALQAKYGDLVWSPIRMSVVWEEAITRCLSIFRYAYDHAAAADAWQVVRQTEEAIKNG